MAKQLPRGIRNNNPLNIRHSSSRWRGLAEKQTDSQFCQFKAMRWGLRAAFVILRTYINRYRCDTISKIINRFAPASENNTAAYISSVCAATGLQPHERLKFSDKTKLCSIVKAMHIVENGGDYIPYCDIESGYGMAINPNCY